jgi:hypothetical protein
MADYLFSKFKGVYRVLPELCLDTHDVPRDENGAIDEDAETYISCQYGNKISYWGLNSSRRGVLIAYIPSLQRGRNIKKELKKQKIEIFNYDESAEEVMFHFLASDIEPVATLLKARTSGSNISPFSPKNLPKNKDVEIPKEKMDEYKAISSKIQKGDLLLIKKANASFLTDILEKDIKKRTKNKEFDWKVDARKLKLSRQVKEYIYVRGYWDMYIEYLGKEVDAYYADK